MLTKTVTASELLKFEKFELLNLIGEPVVIDISDPDLEESEHKTAQLVGTIEHIVFAEGGVAVKLQGEGSTPVPESELSKVSFIFFD